MENYLENNEIYEKFQTMFYEHYENEIENRNVYIVDMFPKRISSNNKYSEFEEYLIDKRNLVLNKFLLSMMKIYMYDENIYYYIESENEKKGEYVYVKKNEEYIEYIGKYEKELNEFLEDVKNSLGLNSEHLVLFFSDLKIGFIIGDGYITYSNFGDKKEFVDDIFKSEGLFIRS